jgi:UDP-glucose 4-epimerase
MSFDRVVILGHSGFLGALFTDALRQAAPNLQVLGLSAPEFDLTQDGAAATLAKELGANTALVTLAAIKRQVGDGPEPFRLNVAIHAALAHAIEAGKPKRILHFSSGAVYGEDIENLAIAEHTPVVARSYYGLSKIAAEFMIDKAAATVPGCSVTHLRPATVYGPGDLATAYGPSGFLDAAVHDREITLWGEGEELRELIYVDDVITLSVRALFLDHTGPLNIVAGQSYSFRDALRAVEMVTGKTLKVTSRPRSKGKVDNQYDNSALRRTFPDARFTDLTTGVRTMYALRYGKGTQTS